MEKIFRKEWLGKNCFLKTPHEFVAFKMVRWPPVFGGQKLQRFSQQLLVGSCAVFVLKSAKQKVAAKSQQLLSTEHSRWEIAHRINYGSLLKTSFKSHSFTTRIKKAPLFSMIHVLEKTFQFISEGVWTPKPPPPTYAGGRYSPAKFADLALKISYRKNQYRHSI